MASDAITTYHALIAADHYIYHALIASVITIDDIAVAQ